MFQSFPLFILISTFFNVSGQDSLVIWLNYQGAPQELPVLQMHSPLSLKCMVHKVAKGQGLLMSLSGGFGAYLKVSSTLLKHLFLN